MSDKKKRPRPARRADELTDEERQERNRKLSERYKRDVLKRVTVRK